MHLLDTCVITASSPQQADSFRALLRNRVEHGLYPREVEFKVYSDPEAGRIGSGGSTLLVLSRLWEESRNALPGGSVAVDAEGFFSSRRILILHAGGESRRLPCYAPEGKLFAPVPVGSSSLLPPVVLDMQLSLFFKYPWKKGEVVIASGDVIIDFDCSSLPEDRGDICGFAKPAAPAQGARHGVFRFDSNRQFVVDFFQKATEGFLGENAILEGTQECALDMGIVSLSPRFLAAFLAFGHSGGTSSFLAKLEKGKTKFDFYLEVMTACLRGLSWEAYRSRMEKAASMEAGDLENLFRALNVYNLRAVVTASTTFLHFGSLREFPEACREIQYKGLRPFYGREGEEIQPECGQALILYNSVDTQIASGEGNVFSENMRDSSIRNAGGSNLFFGARSWLCNLDIPRGICIDERRVWDKTIKLIYAVEDSFKIEDTPDKILFCGIPFSRWLQERDLSATDVWEIDAPFDLLAARLFPAYAGDEFLTGYWWMPPSSQWGREFKAARRHSILEVNAADDALTREKERVAARVLALQSRIIQQIGWRNISKADFQVAFFSSSSNPASNTTSVLAIDPIHGKGMSQDEGQAHRNALQTLYAKTDDSLLKQYRKTLLESLTGPLPEENGLYIDFVGKNGDTAYFQGLRVGVKQDQIVWARSPVRLDLAGGWTDTPPYTLRHGGQVVNLAVNLNAQPPIQVFCRPTAERHIRIHSIDLGLSETVLDFTALADFRNPTSPYALPKAAFHLLGFNVQESGFPTLAACLDTLGCGLEITLLSAVPKGSGLGTSSILSATILGALHRFFGRAALPDQVFRQVLQMEQMLTTGGGWQDQIGGVVGGVKYIESKPGLKPAPIIHQLDPFLFQDPRCRDCFTLFYTGITRLAKNILQEVVERFNSNSPAYLFTLGQVKRLAENTREAMGLRRLDLLAENLDKSWEANKRIHAGSANSEVETLLRETHPHYQAAKLLGAGGGGYCLFLSENPRQADDLRKLLRERFENQRARIVDFSLNGQGMEVTTS